MTPDISYCMLIKGRSGDVYMGWPNPCWVPNVGETIETPFHPDSPFVVSDVVHTIKAEGYHPDSDEEINEDDIELVITLVCLPYRKTAEEM